MPCRDGRSNGVSRKLAPLMREVLQDELRRLTGRRRRPSATASAAPVPFASLAEAPGATAEAQHDWAAAVLDHAEQVMAGQQVRAPIAGPSATPFEALDLGLLPDAVAHLVRARGGVAEKELVSLVVAELMLGPLPDNYQRLLGKLVWSAKGRRLIELHDGFWVPGSAEDGVIAELEGRSLDGLATFAGELEEHDTSEEGIFQAVLAELVGEGERAPRIVATAVGAGISLARRRGDLDYNRWGQSSLALESRE